MKREMYCALLSCVGPAFSQDDFVIGDDESSDDYGISYIPDPRDEIW